MLGIFTAASESGAGAEWLLTSVMLQKPRYSATMACCELLGSRLASMHALTTFTCHSRQGHWPHSYTTAQSKVHAVSTGTAAIAPARLVVYKKVQNKHLLRQAQWAKFPVGCYATR